MTIAFTIKKQARINGANHGFGLRKLIDSSNILKAENLFPFIAIKGCNSVGRVYLFLEVILFI